MSPEELAAERLASKERRTKGSQEAVDTVRALRASEDNRRPYADRYKTRGDKQIVPYEDTKSGIPTTKPPAE